MCCTARSSTAQPCDRSLNNFIRLGLGAVLRASVRRHRREHDGACDDGKELESSIDLRSEWQCSSSGPVNQTYIYSVAVSLPAPMLFPLTLEIKKLSKEIKVNI